MKHIALAAALAAAVPGCATTTGKVAGGVAAVSTTLAIATSADRRPCSNEECDIGRNIGTAFLLGVAGVAVIAALIAEHRHDMVVEAAATPIVVAPAFKHARPGGALPGPAGSTYDAHAIELGTSASIEASLGRCSSAAILGERARELDAKYYFTVLVADRAFAGCQ